MGNEQSSLEPQPDAPEESTRKSPDQRSEKSEREYTDLSDISDDRDPAVPAQVHVKAKSSVMAKANTSAQRRRGKKRRGEKSRTSSDEPTSDAPHKSFNSLIPSQEVDESLREREPETFHIYAVSEASAAGEEDDDRNGGRSNSSSRSHSQNKGDEERSSPSRRTTADAPSIQSSTAASRKNRRSISSPEAESLNSQKPSWAAVNSHPQVEASQGAAPPEVQKQADGRWPCPYADEHQCTATFAGKKGATRHAQSHMEAHICIVCKKRLGRIDTLKAHLVKRHTTEEIAAAKSVFRNRSVSPDQDNSDIDHSGKFTTPPEAREMQVVDTIQDSVTHSIVPEKDDIANSDVEETVSEQVSSSPSVFDQSAIETVVDTPVANKSQKRKRGASKTLDRASQKPTKRRKQTSNTPPTSIQSKDSNIVPDTEKIVPRLQKHRQSGIDDWAKRLTPTATQSVSVVVPRMTQAQSSSNKSLPVAASSSQRTLPTAEKTRSSSYTTSHGKDRAEPNVTYVSPTKSREKPSSTSSKGRQFGMATSIAKRTPQPASRKQSSKSEDSGFGSEDGQSSESDSGPSASQSMIKTIDGAQHSCHTCKKVFKTKKLLERHLQNPKVHSFFSACSTCHAKFPTKAALTRHIAETGHRRSESDKKTTGSFTEKEVEKLHNWRDMFCDDHNITAAQFNDMMTDTLSRTSSKNWQWHFIEPKEFMKEYFDVLPHRDRRSMLRYRERNFQNLEGSLNWTEEDDRELLRLYKDYGTSWAKIAKRMNRTADSVSQRWRHKLRYRDTGSVSGEWKQDEILKFDAAIEEVRKAARVQPDDEEWHIPWTLVSKIMETRTAQQCSNRWRSLHGVKKHGVWVRVPGLERTPGVSRVVTPSKMERRLQGSSPRKRPQLSAKFVRDDESDNGSENEVSLGAEVVAMDGLGHADQVDEPLPSDEHRNRLTTRTPGKTLASSQLFQQTQANTSALKPPKSGSQRSRQPSQSQDRPSPEIEIRHRAISRSPLQEINLEHHSHLAAQNEKTDEDGELDSSGEDESASENSDAEVEIEQSADGDDAETNLGNSTVAQEQTTSSGSDEEDTDVHTEAASGARGEDASIDDSDEETSSSSPTSSDDEDGSDGSSRGNDNRQNMNTSSEESDTDGSENDDGDDDDGESDIPDNSMAEGSTDDFMASITKSAAKRKAPIDRATLRGQARKNQKTRRLNADDEETDDSD